MSKGTSVEVFDTLSGLHKVKVNSKISYIADQFIAPAGAVAKPSRSTTAVTKPLEAVDDSDDSVAKKVPIGPFFITIVQINMNTIFFYRHYIKCLIIYSY